MKATVSRQGRGGSLRLRNHCRAERLDLRLLRRMIRELLHGHLDRLDYQLEIHFVGTAEITRLNETYLRHQGPTDVIAFDYSGDEAAGLHGEIFVCFREAMIQARRFHTSCQKELVRYALHGILHLCGYDDRTPGRRRRMKGAEDASLRKLAKRYDFARLAGAGTESS